MSPLLVLFGSFVSVVPRVLPSAAQGAYRQIGDDIIKVEASTFDAHILFDEHKGTCNI